MSIGNDVTFQGITADAFLLSAMAGLRDSQTGAEGAAADPQTVAVLPFTNISGDASQQYLCDGITEDIMIRLARFRELKVATRSAAFRVQGDANSEDAGRTLGVRYIVRGTAIKSGSRMVVSCQLIEAASGNLIWGEKYNREASDIFQVQDEVTGRIVTALGGRVITAGATSARKKPTTNWSAYDYFLKGRELGNAGREAESEPYFAKALQLDPDFALALAWQAIGLLGKFWTTGEREYLDQANKYALDALERDPDEARAHHAAGMIRG